MAQRKKQRQTYSGAVKLREKKLANGTRSLYLDIYRHGKRTYQFLNLYLIGNPVLDGDTRRLAEVKRSQLEIEIQMYGTGLIPDHQKKKCFIDYFREVARSKSSCNWPNTLNYLKLFFGESVTFEELTDHRLTEFRDYLVNTVHVNTAYSYLATTKAALNRAVRDRIIPVSPAATVEPIKRTESRRCYLTINELRQLVQAPCPNAEVRRAFFWACYSGQSRCDVRSLQWHQIEDAWLRYHRGKTKDELVSVALADDALEIIGKRGKPNELVFPNLPANRYIGIVLTKWAQRAGITKNVTFHVARHTFATMSLEFGGDLYTVSKQLGHKHVQTTQIYAKVVDRKKRAMADALPSLRPRTRGAVK